jgi:hypothetical protein
MNSRLKLLSETAKPKAANSLTEAFPTLELRRQAFAQLSSQVNAKAASSTSTDVCPASTLPAGPNIGLAVEHILAAELGTQGLSIADFLEDAGSERADAMLETLRRVCVPTAQDRLAGLQMQREVQQRNLGGADALAMAFSMKLGTLQDAFEWLDFSGTDRFTRVAFETAAILLHIDVESLTRTTKREIFVRMDARRTATVSRDDWAHFFGLKDSEVGQRKSRIPKEEYPAKLSACGSKVCQVKLGPSEPYAKAREGYVKDVDRCTKPPGALRLLRRNSVTAASATAADATTPKKGSPESPRNSAPVLQRRASAPVAEIQKAEKEEPEEEDNESFYWRVRCQLSKLKVHGRQVYEAPSTPRRAIIQKVLKEMNLWSCQRGESLIVMRVADEDQVMKSLLR